MNYEHVKIRGATLEYDALIEKPAIKWGFGAGVQIPKRYRGRHCIVLVLRDPTLVPRVRWDKPPVKYGKQVYYEAEIGTEAGVHRLLLPEKEALRLKEAKK